MRYVLHSLLSSISSSPRKAATYLGLALLAVIAACGGGDSSITPPQTQTTPVQVNIGDAPSDLMLAFTANISSIRVNNTDGVVVLSNTPTSVELIHRTGEMEPIAFLTVPRGTYTGATATIASCTMTYVDPETKTIKQKTLAGPFTASIPFSSNVTAGAAPLVFNFDLDLEHSLTMDDTGAFQFAPVFHFAAGSTGNGNGMYARQGGAHQMMGVVAQVGSNSFSINALQAAHSFTFRVNTQTQFEGRVTAMQQLAKGMGVFVTATLQSDGTFLASRVRTRMTEGGIMGGGIVTEVVGQPATELTLVMQSGAGAGMLSDYLAQIVNVTLTPETTYEIDSDRVTLTGLPFTPVFDASNVYVGQHVLPISDSGIVLSTEGDTTIGTITASTVRLQEQGIRGTTDVAITPGASASFVLTLFPNCAFTSLTGATQILVYQQNSTNVEDATTIPAGATLRIHGLLFNNAGQWTLVASTIASVDSTN